MDWIFDCIREIEELSSRELRQELENLGQPIDGTDIDLAERLRSALYAQVDLRRIREHVDDVWVDDLRDFVVDQGGNPDAIVKEAFLSFLENVGGDVTEPSSTIVLQSPVVTIADVPYEVLAYLLSWLDMHDVEYSVPRASKLFHTLANDPVTWARMVVAACSYDELLRVVKKHPSITLISNFFGKAVEVVKLCPNLKAIALGGVWSSSPVPPAALAGMQIEHLSASEFDDEFAHLYPYIKSLSVSQTPDVVVLQQLPNLTQLSSATFFEGDPTAAPLLVHLETGTEGINAETWLAFAQSHPQLTSLTLTAEGRENPYIGAVQGLTTLKVFKYEEYDGPSGHEAFLLSILQSNKNLHTWLCEYPLNSECLRELGQLKSLRKLRAPIFKNSSDQSQWRLLRDLDLSELMFEGEEEHDDDEVFSALEKYQPRSLQSAVTHAVLIDMGSRLCNLQELHLWDAEITEPLSMAIGNTCVRLSVFTLRDMDGLHHCEPMLRALRNLKQFSIIGNTPVYQRFARAVGESTRLESLTVSTDFDNHNYLFLKGFFEVWAGGHLRSLAVNTCTGDALALIVEANRSKGLRVRHMRITASPSYQTYEGWSALRAEALANLPVCDKKRCGYIEEP